MSNYSNEIRNLVASEIESTLKDYEGTYACDLAYEMYNNDYYIIGTYQAKQFLKEHFDDMMECLEEYQNEFGEGYKEVADAEKLATLLVLQVAQDVLSSLDSINEVWNDTLDESSIETILAELKENFEI